MKVVLLLFRAATVAAAMVASTMSATTVTGGRLRSTVVTARGTAPWAMEVPMWPAAITMSLTACRCGA